MGYLEHTFKKVGNQIELEAEGFKKGENGSATMFIKVMNKGMSDQVVDNIELKFLNPKFTIAPEKSGKITGEAAPPGDQPQRPITELQIQVDSLADPGTTPAIDDQAKKSETTSNQPVSYYLNGLKAREPKTFEIEIQMTEEAMKYAIAYNLEAFVEFKEFAISTEPKSLGLNFNEMS